MVNRTRLVEIDFWSVYASEIVGPSEILGPPYPDESELSPNTETYIYLYYMVLFLFLGEFLNFFLLISIQAKKLIRNSG